MGDADKLFGALFESDGSSSALSFDANQQAAPAPQEAAAAERQAEWYVVVGGVQIGPMHQHEIEERWDGREIEVETFVWKSGMSDWLHLADCPELTYIITRPQQAPAAQQPGPVSYGTPAAAVAQPGEVTVTSVSDAATAAGLTPAAEAIHWQPSAASALELLIQDEMTGQPSEQTAAAAAPAAATAAPAAALTPTAADPRPTGNFGSISSDPFAPLPTLNTGPITPRPATGSVPQADPFAGFGGAQWSIPTAAPPEPEPEGSELRPIHMAMGAAVLALMMVVALAIYIFAKSGPQPAVPVQPVAGPVAPPTAGVAAPAPAPAPAPTPVAAAAPSPSPSPAPSPPPPRPVSSPTPSRPPPPRPPPRPSTPIKKKLTVQDIVKVVKANQRTVAPCLKRASRGRELLPGKYKIILNWQIKPDGSVSNPRVTGPKSVLNTSLPPCFALAIRKWKFPTSSKGGPVRNFPFGPIKIK